MTFSLAPPDIATCMYYTGKDPFTGEEVYVAQHLRDRKLQRALLQYFRPENYFEVRKALLQAGRGDLIGNGCDALIPSQPPKVALQARQAEARRALGEGRFVHQVDGESQPATADARPAKSAGYRPHRRTAQKRKPR